MIRRALTVLLTLLVLTTAASGGVVYRTDGAWGSGKGAALTHAELDGNLWQLTPKADLASTATDKGDSLIAPEGATNTTLRLSDLRYAHDPRAYMDASTYAAWLAAPTTTDVTTAVQAAINAASNGSGVVDFSGGTTWLVDTLYLFQHVTLNPGYASKAGGIRLVGGTIRDNFSVLGRTTIQHINGSAAPLLVASGTWTTTGGVLITFNPGGAVQIENLTLAGGDQTTWCLWADHINDAGSSVRNTYFWQKTNKAGGGAYLVSCYQWVWDSCRFFGAQVDVSRTSTEGAATFAGSGLDDLTAGTGTVASPTHNYLIEIDGVSAPANTFRYSLDGGSTWVASGVRITGGTQYLKYGGMVTFASKTGHTSGDQWTVPISKTLATGVGLHITSRANAYSTAYATDQTPVAVNMMVFNQVDIYRWGIPLILGERGKSVGTNIIGPMVWNAGQVSHSDENLMVLGRNAVGITITGMASEHAGSGFDGIVITNGAKDITFQNISYNAVAMDDASHAFVIGYDPGGIDPGTALPWDAYEFAWNIKIDGVEFWGCRNGVKINTNATASASVNNIDIDRLLFHPYADAAHTGITVESGYTTSTNIRLGLGIEWYGYSDTNRFLNQIVDPNNILWRPSYANGSANPVIITKTFVDGDVSTASDTVTIAAHGIERGAAVGLSNSGGALPTVLNNTATYYAYVPDTGTIGFAATRAAAMAGGPLVDITAAAGGGTHTVTRFPDVTGKSALVLDPAAAVTVNGFAGGRPGQVLTVMTGTNFANLTLKHGGAFNMTTGANWTPSDAQSMIQFVGWGTAGWYELVRR